MKRSQPRMIHTIYLLAVSAWIPLACLPHENSQGATFTSVANGTWNTGAPWGNAGSTPGTDYPSTGDDAHINNAITVTGNQAFGDAGNQSDWNAGNFNLSGATDSLTHGSGSTFEFTSGSNLQMNGDGEFINQGTVLQNGTGIMFLGVSDPTVFRNQGTLEIANTGRFELHGTAQFLHENGALLQRTAAGVGLLDVHPLASGASFIAQSGSILSAVAATSRLKLDIDDSGTLGQVNNATFQGDGQIEFSGRFTNLSGTVTGNVSVELDGSQTIPTGGTTYNVTGSPEGLQWVSGNMSLSGNNATNNGTFSLTSSSRQINNAGEFINASGATFQYDVGAAGFMFLAVSTGPTIFRNQGLFEFLDVSVTSSIQTHTGVGTFQNDSTGVIRRDVAGIGQFTKHAAAGASAGHFNNLGTVEVTAGEIEITNLMTTTSVSGTDTLTEGTWNILSGTGTAELDLQAGGTSAGSIDTIGAAAKVVLGGNNPIFSQLSSTNLTVNGTFGLQDQKVYALTSDLTAPGILEFGLEGADVGGTLLTGLDVTGNVNFTGGTVDILDLGGMTIGTYRLLEWDGTRTGELTLGSTPNNGFVYELFTSGMSSGFVELNVNAPPPIPEPSTCLLLGLGMFGLLRKARGRRS